MHFYTPEEKTSIDVQIDLITDTEVLSDMAATLESEYGELHSRIEGITGKFNYLLSTMSLVFSFSLILVPAIFQTNVLLKDSFNAYCGFWFSIGVATLAATLIGLLVSYKSRTEYHVLDESALVTLGEYYNKFLEYRREKLKGLVSIVNFNHILLERRKQQLRRFVYPIVVAVVLILMSAPVMLIRADDPSSVDKIANAIKSVQIQGVQNAK
jgi:ElaB/YqjD/DUF883 family membrane-anchored ribosome-binding protein